MQDINIHEPLAEEERNSIIESTAQAIVKRGMGSVAVLFLEMHKPLSFIASQSMMVAMPFIGPLVGMQRMANAGKLLADRANVERLITRIEDMSNESKEG